MNKSIIAIFCIFLIISSPVSAAFYGYGDEDDPQNLGEALIIDVDHIEPTPIRSDYFQNREFNAYAFLNGKTLGTLLFGDHAPETAPFYGDMKIKNIKLTPNKESGKYIAGLSSIVRPKGEELTIDPNGDINLGYTRVRFKKMSVESEVPDTIDIDVSARIYFDVNTGFGSFGTQSLNLQSYPNEDVWKESGLEESKIWGGRGYLRIIEINSNSARVQLYDGGLKKILLGGSENLISGDAAKQFNLPGGPSLLENFLTIKLDRISRDPNSAKLQVEDLNTKTISEINVVRGMKPFIGSLWEIKDIYRDRIVFINEEGNQKILDLDFSKIGEDNPCANSPNLDADEIVGASSSDLYCQSIREYERAIDYDPENIDLIYQSHIGIAQAYEGLFASELSIEHYQLANNVDPTKFEQEYGALLGGLQRRVQEKLNYFLLDENIVSLLDINIGDKEDSFTYFEKDSPRDLIEKTLGDTLLAGVTDPEGNKYSWQVMEISANEITIEQSFIGTGTRGLTKKTRTLELHQNNIVPSTEGTKVIYIEEVNISESAIITISPGTRKNYGTSEFTIHLPIEKRIWDWTPEEIDKMINSTDKSMKKLDKIIDKLGNVIKTWKLVCFSTFAILSVKNAFFRNPANKLAQDKARNNCVASTVGSSAYNECYNSQETQDQIKRDTESSKSALDDTKEVMDGFSWEEEDSEGSQARQKAASELGISEEELMLLYRYQGLETEGLSQMIHNKIAWNDQVEVNSWTGEKLESARKIDAAVKEDIGDRKLSEQEIGLIEYKFKQTELGNFEVATAQQRGQDSEDQARIAVDQTYGNPPIVSGQGGSPLGIITENGREYVYVKETYAVTDESGAVVKDQDGKIIYGDKLVKRPVEKAKDNKGAIIEGYYYNSETGNVYLGGTVVNNYMIGYQGSTTVQYDQDTKKPSSIPFQYNTNDFSNSINTALGYGNYIVVDDSATYHYSLWNPGPDGAINTRDDEPVITSQLLPGNRLPGYDRLASEVERAYTQASVGNGKEGESVVVRGKNYATNLAVSGVASGVANAQGNCEDIMSPTDCKILYNVCDPVMCPPSRFNLGGKWNVMRTGSVVEKGIIGSLVLGWGNGDLLPICLTGIHAGLENIYSMLGSFRDCLETSRVNGESVGICNEIRSLYMCDILWQEALALVNVAGKLSSWISTSIFGKSGGGEYKFWDSSWSKLSSSVSFFTKDYASGAFAAFTSRSTDEIGSEICKAAIFGKMPAGGDLIGQLTSPESPTQFTGWFEEDRFTDVNLETDFIPSSDIGTGQSAYRIYYHIYAGRDRDITYRVVLKDIAGGVIPVTDERSFTSGNRFLKKGETIDKSFVLPNLPPGFSQMCIIIDGSERCGFGSISSSFTAEYLKQQIVQGAIGKIENAKDCVPEQRNYVPGAFTSGVKRVCSVYDPDGAGDEWEYIGNCGTDEQGRNLGNCYLYAKGVKQSIIDSTLEAALNASVDSTEAPTDKAKEFEVYLAEKANREFEEIKQESKAAQTTESKINLIKRYHNFASRAPNNDMAAESYYKVGKLISSLATETFVKAAEQVFTEKASECEILYDGDGGIDTKGYFSYFGTPGIWNYGVARESAPPKSDSVHGIHDFPFAWEKILKKEDCRIYEDDNLEDLCKDLVGKDFNTGLKILVNRANNPPGRDDDHLTIIKGEEFTKFGEGEAEVIDILKLCGQEMNPAIEQGEVEEFQELIGKTIEVECKFYYPLAGERVKKTIYFKDGIITADSTTKIVESMDEFVDFVYGICSEDFTYIQIKKDDEKRLLESSKIGQIDVKQWIKSVVSGKFVDDSGDIIEDGHPAFELKLYRKKGLFGINGLFNTLTDYTFIWNGYMLEKMEISRLVVDKKFNIVDWDIALESIWSTLKEEWRDVEKIEFKCTNNQLTSIYTSPIGPFSIDAIGIDFKKWVEDSSNACTGSIGTSSSNEPIQTGAHTDLSLYSDAARYGLDVEFVKAVIKHESNFDSDAISHSGCSGLMQICGRSAPKEIIKVQCSQDRDNGPQKCDPNSCSLVDGAYYWCSKTCSSGDNNCVDDDRFDPAKNIKGGILILNGKMSSIGNCGTDKIKAWTASYNLGALFVKDAINRVGNCNSWDKVWQKLYDNSNFNTNTYTMKDGTTHKKSWLTESKINGLKGKSSDYVGKIYATYLAYLSSPDNAVVENAQKEYLTWGNGTRDECEPGMKDELTNYWNSVGWDTSRWTCSSVPWSAAFISYIMKTSGINFPYNAAHSKYFFDIKAAPSNYDCKTYDVHKDLDKLKAGDLLCRNREGLSQTYANLAREGSGHCDVVIEVGPTIVLIGGNVGDSVDKKTVTQSKVLVTGKDSYYGFISCL